MNKPVCQRVRQHSLPLANSLSTEANQGRYLYILQGPDESEEGFEGELLPDQGTLYRHVAVFLGVLALPDV